MAEEPMHILKRVEAGTLSAEDAAKLLAAHGPDDPEPAVEMADPASGHAAQTQRWSRFWIYPLMAGGAVLILGLTVMSLVYATDAATGWRVCGWLPMILGLVLMLLAWWSRRARWLHLRISKAGRREVAFSIPLPLTLVACGLHAAQFLVPQLKETGVDDLIIALRDSMTGDEPLFVDVQDEEEGERVQVYIG